MNERKYSWWKSNEEHYYGVYIRHYGKIKGTYRFLIAYISTRNILCYPLWRIKCFLHTTYNRLFTKEKSLKEQIQNHKSDRRHARGLTPFLSNKMGERKMNRRSSSVKVGDLPQIGGKDSEEYDESCIRSVKPKGM